MAKKHALTLSILAAGSAVFAMPVMAQGLFAPAQTEDVTLEIEYNRADLATEAGVDRLYEQIVGRALNACAEDGELLTETAARRKYDACASSLVSLAVSQISDPSLTARYEASKLRIASLE